MKTSIKAFIITVTLGFMALFSNTASAQDWLSLGSKTVTKKADFDTVTVRQRGAFSKLQLAVKNSGVKVQRMVVHFKNGQRHEVKIHAFIARDSKSRLIDLPGKARAIDKITFWYDAKGVGRKGAIMTVLGKR